MGINYSARLVKPIFLEVQMLQMLGYFDFING